MSELKIYFKNKYYRSKFKLILILPIIIFLILFDLITKTIVQNTMSIDETKVAIEWLFNFHYILNKGGAGGFMDDKPGLIIAGATITTIFLIVAFIIVNETKFLIPISIVIAGSAGNLIGRIWGPEGAVVDFLEPGTFLKKIVFWAPNGIFNIADLLVNIGIIIMFIVLFIYIAISIYELQIKRNQDLFEHYIEREVKLFKARRDFENSKGYIFKPEISWSVYKENIKKIKRDFVNFKKQNKHASS
ncbi:lipoprotein signal peptidase [Spiroplasma sp. TIUS-1]|uniref:signal peptidase II n=1 Tax=Spiroplasma sp. TIUS-1 TaxID=216963 RepID=UPI00139892F3|nr:signal peptidase II [Spiroplasma sp. TIUS-1]QHX35993.1 lipoprotein signal peptidase [Spiroplasma sp. TIUS-1]